jgi:hypothetical protein
VIFSKDIKRIKSISSLMFLQVIKRMAKKIHDLADEMQFNNDIILAKKYMRRVGTEQHQISQWELRVKQLRLKKKDPKRWAAQRTAIARAKRTAEQLKEQQRKRMSHITIDQKSQPIFEEDIDNNKQEKDWMDGDKKPSLEGSNEEHDKTHQ